MANTKDVVDQLVILNNKIDDLENAVKNSGTGGGNSGGGTGNKGNTSGGPATNVFNTAADASKNFANHTAYAFEQWTGINERASTFAGQMAQIAGTQGIGALRDGLNQAADKLNEIVRPTNIFANLLDKVVEKTIEYARIQDKAFSQFEKQVGNVKLYADQITNITTATAAFGTTIEDTTGVLIEFKKSFAGFESLSKDQQTTIATTSTQLSKLGIATTDLAYNMEFLVKAQGQTVEEADNLQKSLYATANAMGIPPARMVSEFGKAAPALAGHGRMMTKVFLDLQNGAKNTGIAFDNLLQVTSKFNTFEAAAQSAGELNAILGGDYLNSIELLNANEGERVRILQESLKMSGKNIKDMGIQEQQAAANAIGLKDVTELQKLMSNETSKRTVETIKAQKAQEEMNKATKSATELGDKINSLFTKLAINMRPVIETLKDIVDYYISWSEALGRVWDEFTKELAGFPKLQSALTSVSTLLGGISKWMSTPSDKTLSGDLIFVAKGFLGLVAAWVALKAGIWVMKLFGSAASSLGKVGSGIKNVGAGIASAVSNIGKAASKNITGILALGAAFLMFGAGIALAAGGIAYLATSISSLNPAQLQVLGKIMLGLFVVLGLFAVALVAVAFAGSAAAVPMLALGAAFLMLGASVALAGYGISLVIDSIGKSATAIGDMIVKIIEASANALYNVGQILIDLFKELSGLNSISIYAASFAITALAGSLTALFTVGAGGALLGASQVIDFLNDLNKTVTSFDTKQVDLIAASLNKIKDAMCNKICTDLINTLKKLVSSDLITGIDNLEKRMIEFSLTLEQTFLGGLITDMGILLDSINEMVKLLEKAQQIMSFIAPETNKSVKAASKPVTPTPQQATSAAVTAVRASYDMNNDSITEFRQLLNNNKNMSSQRNFGDVYIDGTIAGKVLGIDEAVKAGIRRIGSAQTLRP